MIVTLYIDGPNLRKQRKTINYEQLIKDIEETIGVPINHKHIYGYAKSPTIAGFLQYLRKLDYHTHYGHGNYKYKLIRDLQQDASNIIVLVTTDKMLVSSLQRGIRLIIAGYERPYCPGLECIKILESQSTERISKRTNK